MGFHNGLDHLARIVESSAITGGFVIEKFLQTLLNLVEGSTILRCDNELLLACAANSQSSYRWKIILENSGDFFRGKDLSEGVVKHMLQLFVGIAEQMQGALYEPGSCLNEG